MFAGDWFEGERVSRTLRGRHGLLLLLLFFLSSSSSAKKLAKSWPIPGEVRGICVLSRDRFPLKAFFSGSHLTDRLIATFRLVFLLVSFNADEKKKKKERKKEGKGANESWGAGRRGRNGEEESLVEYEFFEVRIADPDTQGRLEGVRMGNKVS